MMWDKEIDISQVEGLRCGNAQDEEACTGVTALIFPEGAMTGCRILGGGPAGRETGLTFSETAENAVHAVILSGGSAYGLAAADGVMTCLEEKGIGYRTGFARVPLVLQSCVYDLNYGSSSVRPDAAMGREACGRALEGRSLEMGCVGAGAGATVGKMRTMRNASKSGLGWFAVQLGSLQAAAAVCVNAMGDVFDPASGEKLAGLRSDDRKEWRSAEEELVRRNFLQSPIGGFVTNTTIGCFITNAAFSKAQMNKIAQMAAQAYPRCIRPAATMSDGDTVYAASTGKLKPAAGGKADVDLVGVLAAAVMERAICRAVRASRIPEEEFLKKIN